jgi:hypothetical protein
MHESIFVAIGAVPMRVWGLRVIVWVSVALVA